MPSLSSFLPTVNPGKSFSMMNAVMPLYPAAGSMVAKRMNTSGFFAVGDPELAAVEDVVAAFEFGFGLQGEGVGAGTGFAEGVGAAQYRRPCAAGSVSSARRWSNAAARY